MEIIRVSLRSQGVVNVPGGSISIRFGNDGNQSLRKTRSSRYSATLRFGKRAERQKAPMLIKVTLEMIMEPTIPAIDSKYTDRDWALARVRLVLPLSEVIAYTGEARVKCALALGANEREAVVAIFLPFQRTSHNLFGPMIQMPAVVENNREPRHCRDRTPGHGDARVREGFWVSRIRRGLAARRFFARRCLVQLLYFVHL
jgi:hypothetical protein